MIALEQALQDYLALRRSLGYKLARSELLLAQFVAYLNAEGASTITTELALAWAMAPGRSRSWSAIRMSAVRAFARYLHTRDASCDVPPSDILRPRPRSRVPFLYSRKQLDALLGATGTLSSPLRAATFRSLICLLAATGIRISEAIGLDREDLDQEQRLLLIRHGKFGKQRLLPLHDTTSDALAAYLHRPDRRQRA
ncbi:MAG: tyrosine-type recombinase/integrase, partial [Actinobacteria bacterium]|nr:tyrosine-type recombinase/integrase [Actinomycetota bacterium]